MPERIRWKIAYLVNRLRGQCWADLVSWVLDGPRLRKDAGGRLPWRPITETCQADKTRDCYCGKLRASQAEQVPEARAREPREADTAAGAPNQGGAG